MTRTRILTGALMIAAVSVLGCETQQSDVLGPDDGVDTPQLARDGNGKPGGGGGDGSAPPDAVVTVTSSGTNAIACDGNRVGGGFSTVCEVKSVATCPDADAGMISVGLIEVLERKGEMDRVVIHGKDGPGGEGTAYSTGQVPVENPHRWDPAAGDFTFYPEVTAVMTKAKGKSNVTCTVSLGSMHYDFE